MDHNVCYHKFPIVQKRGTLSIEMYRLLNNYSITIKCNN